jgi:sigma-E factor negative regulatory protein RseC
MRANHLSVTATVADSSPEHIGVMVEQSSSCGSCLSKTACGTGKPSGRIEISVNAAFVGNFQPGKRLEMMVPAKSLGKMAVLAYLLPALSLFLGAAMAASFAPGAGDPGALAGAVLGLLVGCWLLRLYDARCNHAGWKVHDLSAGADPQVCFNKS